jgi:hypothetical protein
MAIGPTDPRTSPTLDATEPPVGPIVPVPSLATAAWLYGALLDRGVIRGLPRDPQVRREVASLRGALVRVLPLEATDAEMERAAALEKKVA